MLTCTQGDDARHQNISDVLTALLREFSLAHVQAHKKTWPCVSMFLQTHAKSKIA